jgi:hypothetical protein
MLIKKHTLQCVFLDLTEVMFDIMYKNVIIEYGYHCNKKKGYYMKKSARILVIAIISLSTVNVYAHSEKSQKNSGSDKVLVREVIEIKKGESCSSIVKRTKHALSLETCQSLVGNNNPGGSLVYVVMDSGTNPTKSPYSGIFADGSGWMPVDKD